MGLAEGGMEVFDDEKMRLITDDHKHHRAARSPSGERTRKKDRYSLADFNFIRVLGKGSFGKVKISLI